MLELDLSPDEGEDVQLVPSNLRRSKQQMRPKQIIPTEAVSGDSSDEDGDAPVTLKNIEARSRALDAKAAEEADLDLEEFQQNDAGEQLDDLHEAEVDGEAPFKLPTAEEREEAKHRVEDVHVVQTRMKQCVHVLRSFGRRAEQGRLVTFSQVCLTIPIFS